MKKAAAALFVSFKAARAIPCARPLRRDFMIQSTLDPGVRRIDFHPAVALDDRLIRTDAIVLHRDDGRFAVDFVDARLPEDPQGEGLLEIAFRQECAGIFSITAPDVGREPRMSAAREVWRHSVIAVNANDRAQVLDALDREGPVPLRAFDGLVATSRDCEEVVYAMACEGSVDIDLSAGLDDGRAIVSGGSLGLRCRA